jgi:chromosome segregation ATPase
MTEQEHEQVHEQLEREADDLERQSDKLEEQIKDARGDWEAKKSDESIPGAQPEEDEHRDGPPPEADITPGD